jgi:hypothetical protein
LPGHPVAEHLILGFSDFAVIEPERRGGNRESLSEELRRRGTANL